MVRAILDGRKTQTRRIVKLRDFRADHTPGYDWCFRGRFGCWSSWKHSEFVARHCRYGQPGDRLWARESFKAEQISLEKTREGGLPPLDEHRFRATIEYAASPGEVLTRDVHLEHWRLWLEDGRKRWKPSIHMPRWASRITLELTSVRVERLQEISEEDAKAEGAERASEPSDKPVYDSGGSCVYCPVQSYRTGFPQLWESINGPGSWDANPWVWLLTFRRLEAE